MNRINKDWKRNFFVLWTGQGVSIFTKSVIQMAIIWYLTQKTGSAAMLSLATLLGFLPQAILGLFVGGLIDRHSRKSVMVLSNIFTAAVTLILVFAGMFGELPIWLILVVLFARSIGTAFHTPALQAVTPLIVPKESLTRCAGYSQTFKSASMLLSPVVAAIIYAAWSINIIFLIDVVGALFAVFMLVLTKIPPLITKEAMSTHNFFREAKEGLALFRNEPGMRGLLIISALYAVIYMPIGTLYPLISMSYFKGTVAEASMVEVAFFSGTLLGSLVLGFWKGKMDKIAAIAKSIGGMGLGLVITGMLPSSQFNAFLGLALFMGTTTPFYWGAQTVIYQTKFKPEYLGRVMSISSGFTMFSMPIGLILAGSFAQVIGVEKWFLFSGILALFLAMSCALIPTIRKCCEV